MEEKNNRQATQLCCQNRKKNARNESRNKFLKRNKNQTNSFKYVKDKGSRLIPADLAHFKCRRWDTNRWKNFCLLPLITKERLPLLFSWFFILNLLLIPSVFFLFYFLLASLYFLSPLSLYSSALFFFFLSFFPRPVKIFTVERKEPFCIWLKVHLYRNLYTCYLRIC